MNLLKGHFILLVCLIPFLTFGQSIDFLPEVVSSMKVVHLNDSVERDHPAGSVEVVVTSKNGNQVIRQLEYVLDEATNSYVFGLPQQRYFMHQNKIWGVSYVPFGIRFVEGKLIPPNLEIEQIITDETKVLSKLGESYFVTESLRKNNLYQVIPVKYLINRHTGQFSKYEITHIKSTSARLSIKMVNENHETIELEFGERNSMAGISVQGKKVALFEWPWARNDYGVVGIEFNETILGHDGSLIAGGLRFDGNRGDNLLLPPQGIKVLITEALDQVWIGPADSKLITRNGMIYGFSRGNDPGTMLIVQSRSVDQASRNIKILRTVAKNFLDSENLIEDGDWKRMDVLSMYKEFRGDASNTEQEIFIRDVEPLSGHIRVTLGITGRPYVLIMNDALEAVKFYDFRF